MGLSFRTRARTDFSTNTKTKHAIKQLLTTRNKLVHDDIPYAAKGMEGMKIAHEILITKKAIGLLIGGLLEQIWNTETQPEDLIKHKDVDVMVLTKDTELNRFEGGIDWWLPFSAEITTKKPLYRPITEEVTWYKNGNGAILNFGAYYWEEKLTEPGLYIIDSDRVVDMRVYEAKACSENSSIWEEIEGCEFDEYEFLEYFRQKIRNNIGETLAEFVRDEFKDFIIEDNHWSYANFQEFDSTTVNVIKVKDRRLKK